MALLLILLKIALIILQGTGNHLAEARLEEVVPDIAGSVPQNPTEKLPGNPDEDVSHSAPAPLGPCVVGHGIRAHVNFKK